MFWLWLKTVSTSPLPTIALTHAVWFFDLDIFAGCSLVDVQVIVGRGEIDKTSVGAEVGISQNRRN